tara:strand:- start:546 stop:1196 length:651 start_codon:yes stop_codon:yes gene_type:complete
MKIKDKYKVESIKPFETYDWLKNKHYAKRVPSISYAFGLFKDKILEGICTFGSPPSNALCIGICGEEYKSYVIELNRLCVNKQNIENVTSYFLGKCLKSILKPKIVVSYADTSQNHHGYIYQATNWIYTGLSAKRTERYDKNNPNKHSKTVTESMNYNELSVRERPQKHRYVMFLGNKAQRKKMLNSLNYEIKPYPKGQNKRYDASYEPKVQLNIF